MRLIPRDFRTPPECVLYARLLARRRPSRALGVTAGGMRGGLFQRQTAVP
jgi:hypothetical protein